MFEKAKAKVASQQEEAWRETASEIWNAAKAAADSGDLLFGCVINVSQSDQNFGMGGPKGNIRSTSPAPLLQQVEALGWRLDKADHVFVQTTGGVAGNGKIGTSFIGGVVQGHYLFRRAPA